MSIEQQHSRTATFRLPEGLYQRFVDACEANGFSASKGMRVAILHFVEDLERGTRYDFLDAILTSLGEARANELGSWIAVFAHWLMGSFENYEQAINFIEMPRGMRDRAIASALDDFLALPEEERQEHAAIFEADTEFQLDREKLGEPPSERIAGEMRRQVQVESNGHVRNR